MKIKFNKYVEAFLLWVALGGVVMRQWLIPSLTWDVQCTLFGLSFVLLNLIWIFHYLFNEWLNKRLPFEKNVRVRIAVQVLGGWSMVKCIFLLVIYSFTTYAAIPPLSIINKPSFAIAGMMIFLMNTVICLGFIASHLLKRSQEMALRTAQLEKEKVQVQLDSLKNQISPHFLFNSLSSLDSLIDDNPVLARQFLQQLAKVFRYVIQNKEKALVSIDTELNFIKNYVSLLHTRFDGAFTVTFTIEDEALEQAIVPVTLQILLENAIKHNIANDNQPLTVEVAADADYLTVTNPIQRKKQVGTINGQGLANLKMLYSFLSKKPVLISDQNGLFVVRIPLLPLAIERNRSRVDTAMATPYPPVAL